MTFYISIPAGVLDEIAGRAQDTPHEEVCGAIVRGVHFPIFNVAPEDQRSRRFRMDPQQQLAVWSEWGRKGDLVVYHSHPSGTAAPSHEDKWVMGRSEGITFVIYSIKSRWFRAYRFHSMELHDVKIVKTDISTQTS